MIFRNDNKMTRRTILSVILTLAALAASAVPVVRSFTSSTYGAGAQNWDVAQDSLGRIYFGNRYGLLCYDSRSWQLLRMPNYSTVRSIMIDDNKERIYVGASEEFGYFDVSPETGAREYKSLTGTIDTPNRHFTEIWNIHRDKRTIWFQSDFEIFRYNGTTTVAISFNDKITATAFINGRLYAGMQNNGLVTVNDRTPVAVEGAETLRGKRIVSILPDRSGGIIVVTDFGGLYQVKGGVTTPLEWSINSFLKENQAFCATYNPVTRQYAFGTVNAGAVIVSADGDALPIYINVATGMQNNTVLNIYFDREANLWMALDNGIDYAIINSPINPLPFGNILGAGYTSLRRGGSLYLGTNRGLFTLPYPTATATSLDAAKTPLIKGQVWSMDTISSEVLVGGDAGLFYSAAGGGFRPVAGVGGTWSVKALRNHPGYAIASTYDGFVLLQRTPAGEWKFKNRIAGRKDASGNFRIDADGNIWIAHWMRGIYRLHLNDSLTAFDRENLYNSHHGLPTDRNNIVSEVDGKLVFSTEGGFYRFNEKSKTFEPDERYNKMFNNRRSARLYQASDNEIWSLSPDYVWRSKLTAAGGFEVDTTTYQPLGAKLIPGFDHMLFLEGHKAIVASQDGFYEINANYHNPSPAPLTLFISQVYANQDSLIYVAPLAPMAENLIVPYNLNSLKFEFVTPEYRAHNAMRYSFMLEGYDKTWSSWSKATAKEYTHLWEGEYTLHVRSYDAYTGEIVETEFPFRVLAPWYRSTPAAIIYLLLICAGIYGAYRLIRRKSRMMALNVERRKEQEMEQMKRHATEEALRKDYEIAQLKSQQLEHDIKHKSEELSNITMNVIRKNEILLDISNKLSKVSESLPDDTAGTATGKQISRIQKLIQENISHDDDWRSFTQNFDVVYENYTKRLIALHPELNSSDQRICCYLKMGLSSKEIAPLFNISYRSVEMTRYRLRKKMGLSRDINLVDYLQKI